LPTSELIAAVKRIVRVLRVPLTIDLEHGYSSSQAEVAKLVLSLVGQGVVGINIEDGAESPQVLAEKIVAIREAVDREGVRLFINARTDVYLRQIAHGEEAIAMTIERGKLYANAGADGLFVPCLVQAVDATRIVRETALPVNVMALPKMPDLAQLSTAGVKRISVGPAPFQLGYGFMLKAVERFIQNGDIGALFSPAHGLPRMNELLS
jgi:2-methylisocitrate lyase-like PEP mutase family enzyme